MNERSRRRKSQKGEVRNGCQTKNKKEEKEIKEEIVEEKITDGNKLSKIEQESKICLFGYWFDTMCDLEEILKILTVSLVKI